jgi:hypothetical protein
MPILDFNQQNEIVQLTNKAITRQIEFGVGDINVASGLLKSDDVLGVVCFSQKDPGHIGSPGVYEKYQEVDMIETPVRLVFEKVESIEVLIKSLQEAKRYMIQGIAVE